jgi:hypothetical protein
LFTLGSFIEVPSQQIAEHRALPSQTLLADQWPIKVRCSPHRPSESYATVLYRGNWFWIEDTDLCSKLTLGSSCSFSRSRIQDQTRGNLFDHSSSIKLLASQNGGFAHNPAFLLSQINPLKMKKDPMSLTASCMLIIGYNRTFMQLTAPKSVRGVAVL